MLKLTVAIVFMMTSIGFSQSLHEDIKRVYDFSPGKMTREDQDKKIPLMDEFWKKVSADTIKYLPELRAELQIDGNPKFFYFEGGQLLLSLSKSMRDKQIVLKAILKCDLDDIDRRSIVSTLNYLAKSKLNTTEAALKLLDDKEFQFFLPEHSFYFNQGYCLTYALLPTSSNFYVTAVIERFSVEQDVKTKKSIITLLWFTNSCDGNEFLKGITTDKSLDKGLINYTKDLLTRKSKKDRYFKFFDNMTFNDLEKAQIASTNRMSDEAIYELDYITKLLRKNTCRQPDM